MNRYAKHKTIHYKIFSTQSRGIPYELTLDESAFRIYTTNSILFSVHEFDIKTTKSHDCQAPPRPSLGCLRCLLRRWSSRITTTTTMMMMMERDDGHFAAKTVKWQGREDFPMRDIRYDMPHTPRKPIRVGNFVSSMICVVFDDDLFVGFGTESFVWDP